MRFYKNGQNCIFIIIHYTKIMNLQLDKNRTDEERFELAYMKKGLAKIKKDAIKCANEHSIELIRHEADKMVKKLLEFGAENKNADLNLREVYLNACYARNHARNVEEIQLAMNRIINSLEKINI